MVLLSIIYSFYSIINLNLFHGQVEKTVTDSGLSFKLSSINNIFKIYFDECIIQKVI